MDQAGEPSARERTTFMKSVAREVIETVLLAALVFLLIQLTFQNFRVKGASMDPNLREGEHLLVNKVAYLHIDPAWLNSLLPFLSLDPRSPVYLFGAPQRGDIMVFRFPRDPSRDFIKRVIAVAGETIEIRSGRVFVNGQPLEEPYVYDRDRSTMPALPVPADSFFMMGDNRLGSNDSRDWGAVPRQYIVGKAWLAYWPINSWGFVPNYSYARPNP